MIIQFNPLPPGFFFSFFISLLDDIYIYIVGIAFKVSGSLIQKGNQAYLLLSLYIYLNIYIYIFYQKRVGSRE